MRTSNTLSPIRIALSERVPATALTAIGVTIVVLAPLPSVRQLIGLHIPVSLDPVTVFVAIGFVLALAGGVRFPFLDRPGLLLISVVNLELLLVAWYRAYGHNASPASLALYGHSVVIFLAGPVAVMCIAHDRPTWIAIGITALLTIVAVSVLAEWIGIYRPPVEEIIGPLSVKPNGGVMLQGNEAGALVGTFSVPAAILLRSVDHRSLAVGVVATSLPVLFITRSREGIIVFAITLLAAAIVYRQRSRGAVVLTGCFLFALVLAAAVRPDRASRLINDPNGFLSGRLTLWRAAFDFVDAGNLWLNGGGLGRFDSYVRGELGYAFTTHNEYLRLLVDGGVLMVAGWLALLAILWIVARDVGGAEGKALEVAVVGSAFLGLTKDDGSFTHGSVWIWAFAALAVRQQAHESRRIA